MAGALLGMSLGGDGGGLDNLEDHAATGFAVGAVVWPVIDAVLAATMYEVPPSMSTKPQQHVGVVISRDEWIVQVRGSM
jgi:hypothetical protein